MPETDPEDDEEPLPAADLNDLVWYEQPVPDSRKFLCIHGIPRPATPTSQPIPATPPLHPNQGAPVTPPQSSRSAPETELLELDIPKDIPDLLDVPQKVMSHLDAWAHDVFSCQFW